MDRLLFLETLSKDFLKISGDGVLIFGRLIAAGLADVKMKANNNDLIVTYTVNISRKGRLLVDAWRSGDHAQITQAVAGPVPGLNSAGRVPKARISNDKRALRRQRAILEGEKERRS